MADVAIDEVFSLDAGHFVARDQLEGVAQFQSRSLGRRQRMTDRTVGASVIAALAPKDQLLAPGRRLTKDRSTASLRIRVNTRNSKYDL